MSGSGEDETGLYEVVSGTVITREGDDEQGMGELVRHKPGDVVELRHAEVGGKEVVPVEDDEDDAGAHTDDEDDESATSEDTADTEDADEDAQSDESEAAGGGPPEPLTDEWLDGADYDDLRAAAKNYESINGNWGEDRLAAELAEKTE